MYNTAENVCFFFSFICMDMYLVVTCLSLHILLYQIAAFGLYSFLLMFLYWYVRFASMYFNMSVFNSILCTRLYYVLTKIILIHQILYISNLLYYTGLSKKMDGIWNRCNLKSTVRIYTFGILKCSEKFKVLDLP
jgi:hypothetical protein